MDIEEMLIEAEHGKRGNLVESRITKDAMPFWIALKDRVVKDKIEVKPYVVCRLLQDNFGINISETAMRRYLRSLGE
jgi:hypothetical protein|tara:strand:- start:2211 stop:2441 length:231 start_codon:yes stop_codon:yes gene_type:complete